MPEPELHARFAKSAAFLELQPLRIPSGWNIGINALYTDLRPEDGNICGSLLFCASNEGRRFGIEVTFEPEFDPNGRFHLTVEYQPWPRTERGRRRNDLPFAFDINAEKVHHFETASYTALLEELENWIGRCTLWMREGH